MHDCETTIFYFPQKLVLVHVYLSFLQIWNFYTTTFSFYKDKIILLHKVLLVKNTEQLKKTIELQQEKIDDTRLIRSWDALFQCTSMNFFTQNFKNIFLFLQWYSWKIAMALNNNLSLTLKIYWQLTKKMI
jgi:hypothetical protein